MGDSIIQLKTIEDSFEVEYEILSTSKGGPLRNSIANNLNDIEKLMADNQSVIDQLNIEIDRLTDHSDSFDYTIAVASGILTGMIDSFFVGEFNFTELKTDSHRHVNHFIEKFARLYGYEDKGQGLKGAISFLEQRFPVEQDNLWKGAGFSSTRLHHLDDIAHHPTILGLLSSVGVALFHTAIFVDRNGGYHLSKLSTNKKDFIINLAPIVISGILRWLVHLAVSKYVKENSKNIPKPIHRLLVAMSYSPAIIQILEIAHNWFGHLVSDMGGSKNTPGGGMGISGIFISFLKEVSSLPFLKETQLPSIVSDLYSKNKYDMRAEIATMEYVGKQSIPVLLNELFVRTFYFVRHLIVEYKKNDSWQGVDWGNVIPWGNRTINRMMTIASGTFVAVDAADAAIRAGLKSGGESTKFFSNMLLRINFVGLGRFVIAIGTDAYMGYKCNKLRNERMYRQSEQIMLSSAKVCYKQADMWVVAKNANEAIEQIEKEGVRAMKYMQETIAEIGDDLSKMGQYVSDIEKFNPGLLNEISNNIKYGK